MTVFSARWVCQCTIVLIAAYARLCWANEAIALQNQHPINPQACIAQHQFAALNAAAVGTQTNAQGHTTVALGGYERISPDGRFVLRSFSGGRLGDVSLIELSAGGQVVNTFETPLSNEAFPVQGTWRYIVDTNGDHYQFNSLLRPFLLGKKRITPLFRAGMTGFYAAAAELPSNKPGHVRIRSLSWPNASGSADTQGEGALVSRTVEVDTARHTVVADSGFTSLCTGRVREDGPLYALPMISVDGEEFAALPQNPVRGTPTMRVFGFGADGKSCEARAAFAFSSGKTIFGFAQSARGADLAYEYQAQVWWYSRELGRAFNVTPYIDQPAQTLLASAFPGLTRDGRIVYGTTWRDCSAQPCTERAGYTIVDPYQSNAYQEFLRMYKGTARRECITHGDVARERATFARLHGLATR